MKIFVSHAAADWELVEKLIDLLRLGVGVSADDIFCSSIKGNIPNGELFVQEILKNLKSTDLIIAVLSESYFKSQFCLAEVGAAQVRRIASEAKFHSLLVPPAAYSDFTGVLYGVQSGLILDKGELSELRDIIAPSIANGPKTSMWDGKRDMFLKNAASIIGRYKAIKLLDGIHLHNLTVDRNPAPSVTYKSKLRFGLRNTTEEELSVMSGIWRSGGDSVALQGDVKPLLWQLEIHNGRTEEKHAVLVPSGRVIWTWIGLAASVADAEVLTRCAGRRLGVLALSAKIGGHDFEHEIKL